VLIPSRYIDMLNQERECNRCGWKWVPRYEGEPKKCAGCNSPYWNKERVRPVKGEAANRVVKKESVAVPVLMKPVNVPADVGPSPKRGKEAAVSNSERLRLMREGK
jgi:hypothetical protein